MSQAATPQVASTFTFKSSDDPILRAQPHRLATALIAHADQKPRERVLLYALVFALAPRRCLEIGVRWGGGSRIIHAALSDLSQGVLVSIDPSPALEFDWSLIADRATLVIGSSPADLPRCRAAVDAPFDFVFIDGDHGEKSCHADLQGVADITAPGASILLHDAYHPPVDRAITRALRELPFADVAMPATTRNDGLHVESGRTMTFGGVRWLRRT
ncbi:MAG: class I SAM-dependent methyltransferase [Phycisphaerae bacterium]|nr:class I SAM-dependent methyltransferase [Phycisphaerae bacterium]